MKKITTLICAMVALAFCLPGQSQAQKRRKGGPEAFSLFKTKGKDKASIKLNSYLMAEVMRAVYDANFKNGMNKRLKRHGLTIKGCHRKSTTYVKTQDTHVCVAYTDKLIIVAFRGTEGLSTTKKSIADWMTDLYMAPQKSGRFARKSIFLHKGFNLATGTVLPLLIRDLNKLKRNKKTKKPRSLYLTGHSLGGALAVLTAYKLMKAKFKVAGVYTYGQPRVGNRIFRGAYQPLHHLTHRWVNAHDYVPMVPGRTSNLIKSRIKKIHPKAKDINFWKHVGRTHNISAKGKIRMDDKEYVPSHTRALDGILKYHTQACYAERIYNSLSKSLSKAQHKKLKAFKNNNFDKCKL